MKKLIILLSFVFGIGLTTTNAQTAPKTKGVVTHQRPRGVATVSETTVTKTTTKGGSQSNTTAKNTVKTKPAPAAPNGNKSAQDAWDGK